MLKAEKANTLFSRRKLALPLEPPTVFTHGPGMNGLINKLLETFMSPNARTQLNFKGTRGILN